LAVLRERPIRHTLAKIGSLGIFMVLPFPLTGGVQSCAPPFFFNDFDVNGILAENNVGFSVAYPTKPTLDYSYTGFQQSQGDNSFPGTEIDNDLANVKASLDATIDFIEASIQSDGVVKVAALPDSADLTAYTAAAEVSAGAAADSADAASLSETNAATSASQALTYKNAAQSSASAAAASESNAASTLANALVKANNLSDLVSASTARTNLGLGSFATKSSLLLSDVGSGFFTADATGRGKFASGFIDNTMLPAGSVVQVANTMVGTLATGTALIPVDDSIPQSTEGDQYMTLAITPTSATNKLCITVTAIASSTATGDFITAALFQDSVANALAAAFERNDTAGGKTITFTHYMTAGTTSSTTFKVRVGSNASGTTTFNGNGGARRMGGVAASSITIQEIKV
jgi:hypothetical protein